jgi:hypothetical protein
VIKRSLFLRNSIFQDYNAKNHVITFMSKLKTYPIRLFVNLAIFPSLSALSYYVTIISVKKYPKKK